MEIISREYKKYPDGPLDSSCDILDVLTYFASIGMWLTLTRKFLLIYTLFKTNGRMSMNSERNSKYTTFIY